MSGVPFRPAVAGRLLVVVAVVLVAGCSGVVVPGGTPTATPTAGGTPTPTASGTPTPLADDRDGFTDCQERELLDGADPGRMDVYVEVDWTAGAKPAEAELSRLVEVYDEAPVANPSGERGVDLHLVYGDELPARDRPLDPTNVSWYEQRHFDNRGRGYHYALFVGNLTGEVKGQGEDGTLVVQRRNPELDRTFYVRVFAHELGHSLGLTREVHGGIDTHRVSYEEYPSVMNYRGVYGAKTLDFSNGSGGEGDFDDWAFVAERGYVPDASELDAASAC